MNIQQQVFIKSGRNALYFKILYANLLDYLLFFCRLWVQIARDEILQNGHPAR
jgi:hypothetical protein